MIFIPIWALTLIANILEFTGRKIAANNRRARVKELRRLKTLKKEKARLKQLQVEHLAAVQAEFLRVEKSDKVERDIKARIKALMVPVSDDPYGDDK